MMRIDPALWKEECKGIHEFYGEIGDKVPAALQKSLSDLEARLG